MYNVDQPAQAFPLKCTFRTVINMKTYVKDFTKHYNRISYSSLLNSTNYTSFFES